MFWIYTPHWEVIGFGYSEPSAICALVAISWSVGVASSTTRSLRRIADVFST